MAQVPAGIGRQRYCYIGQPNTAKLIAVRIDRQDGMWISLAFPWRQRCGDPVRCLPAEIEPRDPRAHSAIKSIASRTSAGEDAMGYFRLASILWTFIKKPGPLGQAARSEVPK